MTQLRALINLIGVLLSSILLTLLIKIKCSYRKLENEDEQNLLYYITSKATRYNENYISVDATTNNFVYKIILRQEGKRFLNKIAVFVRKHEYILLNVGDRIPMIYNKKTKSMEIDKVKFNQLIETRKLKKENS